MNFAGTPYITDSSKLLRPDMVQVQSKSPTPPPDTSAEEIVRQLTQIVKEQEAFLPPPDETSESETPKPDFIRYDGDTSSQYSVELLNSNFNLPPQNHSKSHSFETDNTDITLPKFNSEISPDAIPEMPTFGDDYKLESRPKSVSNNRRDFSFPQKFISDESSKIYIIDASTPSPKSKRYVDSSLDSLELYQEPIKKIVEAEIHQQEEESRKSTVDFNDNEFEEMAKEVRDRRRPVTTINLQGACAIQPDYHYQSQIAKMAIKGVF